MARAALLSASVAGRRRRTSSTIRSQISADAHSTTNRRAVGDEGAVDVVTVCGPAPARSQGTITAAALLATKTAHSTTHMRLLGTGITANTCLIAPPPPSSALLMPRRIETEPTGS
jgi:hypothetical protein